jgi:hypothetical protein
MPFPLPDGSNNRRHVRGAQAHLDAPSAANAPNRAIARVVLRAYFMEEAALHPVLPLRARVMSRSFQREGGVLAGIPQAASNPGVITTEILHAETVTSGAHQVASAAFQAPVAHLFPQSVWHATGRDAPHGRRKMAGLFPKMISSRYLKSVSLRYFIFGSFSEEALRFRYRHLTLCATNLDEIALTQIGQLSVITVAQKRA